MCERERESGGPEGVRERERGVMLRRGLRDGEREGIAIQVVCCVIGGASALLRSACSCPRVCGASKCSCLMSEMMVLI